MDGKLDDLRINEIEMIFGYKEHYTDYGLDHKERLQLLGNGFCIQAFVALMKMFVAIFKTNP